MKHFLVVFAASLVLTRTESEDIRGVDYPHEIPFLHDYTLYREHDILFTSPVLDFGPPGNTCSCFSQFSHLSWGKTYFQAMS